MIRNDIYKKACTYIGTTESPKNSNNIIFNTDYYGHPVSGRSYPWCCVFVWDIYRMCNASKYYYGGKKTASCTTLLKWYKKNRPAFVHKDITKMRHGDLVFYQFDNDPSADHIGIFDCAINAKSFYAIEGNTSSGNIGSQDDGDGVYRRVRKISQVMSFVSIQFDDDSNKTDTNPYKEPTKTLKKQRILIAKDDNRWLQWELVESGYNLVIDGKFGKATDCAVRDFQKKHKLLVDGCVGPATRNALKAEF